MENHFSDIIKREACSELCNIEYLICLCEMATINMKTRTPRLAEYKTVCTSRLYFVLFDVSGRT